MNSKRADEIEARRIHLFHKDKKSKAQQLADHANKIIGKKHTAQVHATIASQYTPPLDRLSFISPLIVYFSRKRTGNRSR